MTTSLPRNCIHELIWKLKSLKQLSIVTKPSADLCKVALAWSKAGFGFTHSWICVRGFNYGIFDAWRYGWMKQQVNTTCDFPRGSFARYQYRCYCEARIILVCLLKSQTLRRQTLVWTVQFARCIVPEGVQNEHEKSLLRQNYIIQNLIYLQSVYILLDIITFGVANSPFGTVRKRWCLR